MSTGTTGIGTTQRCLRPVAFSLGANLGDRLAALQGAVDLLAASLLVRELRVSSVYETDPVGGPEQPPYLNAVVVARSGAAPLELLGLAYQVERAYARTRDVRWGPRTLDVDLLVVGDVVSDDPALTLPHPRLHERGFVLTPWTELDADAQVVGRGRVGELAHAVAATDGPDAVRRTEARLVVPT